MFGVFWGGCQEGPSTFEEVLGSLGRFESSSTTIYELFGWIHWADPPVATRPSNRSTGRRLSIPESAVFTSSATGSHRIQEKIEAEERADTGHGPSPWGVLVYLHSIREVDLQNLTCILLSPGLVLVCRLDRPVRKHSGGRHAGGSGLLI